MMTRRQSRPSRPRQGLFVTDAWQHIVPSRTLSGTTLTLSYTCAVELTCGISYTVTVPQGVAVRVTADAGAITLTVPGSVAYKISTHTFVGTSAIIVRRSASSPYAITTSSDVGSVSISPA
jgi:hypothetical protein